MNNILIVFFKLSNYYIMDKIIIKHYDEIQIIDNFFNISDDKFIKTNYLPSFKYIELANFNTPKMTELFAKVKTVNNLFKNITKSNHINNDNDNDNESKNNDVNDINILKMSSALLLGKVDFFD